MGCAVQGSTHLPVAVMWEGRGWYWPLVMAFFSADMVPPWKGRRPASSSYTITPRLQMSAAPAYGFPAGHVGCCTHMLST